MKKLLAAILLLTSLTVVLASCKKEKPQQKITLVMAEVNPDTSICGRMDAAFKQKVEELSNGLIEVDLKYSGVLGDETQVLKLMFGGDNSIQLARVSASLASYGGKKSKLITIPYTFSNAAHFWKFTTSEIAEDILVEPYETGLGVRGLCYAEEGFRNFFATEKISSIEDFKGKNMRVSGAVLTGLAAALQAEPIKVPFTDLYMSMQTGVVDIADQPISNYLTNSLYKVAPYMIMDGHMLGAVQILISSTAWDSLNTNQQKIIKQAAIYASNYCKTICEEEELKAMNTLINEGVTFVNTKNITPWQNACKSMIEESSSEYPELYKQILAIADK